MAFIVGYATNEEVTELERRGWEVEDAQKYNLVGEDPEFLVGTPPEAQERVIAIFVDNGVFDVMNGPDWEKG